MLLEYQESIYPQVGHKYDDRMVISVMIVIDVSRNMVIKVMTERSLQNLPSNYRNINSRYDGTHIIFNQRAKINQFPKLHSNPPKSHLYFETVP